MYFHSVLGDSIAIELSLHSSQTLALQTQKFPPTIRAQQLNTEVPSAIMMMSHWCTQF